MVYSQVTGKGGAMRRYAAAGAGGGVSGFQGGAGGGLLLGLLGNQLPVALGFQ